MKLYEVTNGWEGESYVRVLVIAASEKDAEKLAQLKYKCESDKEIDEEKKEYEQYMEWFGKEVADMRRREFKPLYDKSYYENLEVTCLCEDVSKTWASGPSDS